MFQKRLKAIFDFYLYSNIHIAICALALVQTTCSVFHLRFTIPFILISFFGTLSLYSFQRLVGVMKKEMKDYPGERLQWNFKNKSLLIVIILFSVFPLGYAFFQITLCGKVVLMAAGFLSLIYSSPILPMKGKFIRLRDIPVVKIFFIALVWTMVCVLLPMFGSLDFYGREVIIFSIGEVCWSVVIFLMIFAITIPFDIRDIEFDATSIRSLPMIIGEKKSVRLAQALLIISCLILYSGMTTTHVMSFIQVLYYFLWTAFSVWILHDCSRKKSEYYFTFIIDGLIIALWGFLTFERFI